MIAYLILLLAVFSRFVPHALHGVGLNFTATGGGLLFFGARRPRWQAGIAAGVFALSDVYLTRIVFGYPFHVSSYLITWVWYAGVCLIGSGILRRITAVRVILAALASATSFFLLSDFVVWAGGGLYPHTGAGLMQCYVAAIPFYANDVVSTGLTVGVLFGLPVVAAQIIDLWRRSEATKQRLL